MGGGPLYKFSRSSQGQGQVRPGPGPNIIFGLVCKGDMEGNFEGDFKGAIKLDLEESLTQKLWIFHHSLANTTQV